MGGAVDLIHSLVVYLDLMEMHIGNMMHWLNHGLVEGVTERVAVYSLNTQADDWVGRADGTRGLVDSLTFAVLHWGLVLAYDREELEGLAFGFTFGQKVPEKIAWFRSGPLTMKHGVKHQQSFTCWGKCSGHRRSEQARPVQHQVQN